MLCLMHDTFEWWAQIIIPSTVGVLTLFISGVALWVSHRSTVLAKEVERQREVAAVEREAEAARTRLQDLAIEESRSLYRHVTEATSRSLDFWPLSRRINEPPRPRTALETTRIEAETALKHSLVPGAADLWEITVFDLKNRDARLPDDRNAPEEESPEMLSDRFVYARDQRTFERIRRWALDPQKESLALVHELDFARKNQPAYVRAGVETDWIFPNDLR